MQQPKGDEQKSSLSWSTPGSAKNTSAEPTKALPSPSSPQGVGALSRYVGIFAGGIVVGSLLVWGWGTLKGSPKPVVTGVKSTPQTQTTTAGSNNPAPVTNESLTVPRPQKAGDTVAVTRATVGKPTWVVVYENQDGKPGNVLGARLLFATEGTAISLLRSTVPGQTYFVGKSVDNGDRKYSTINDKRLNQSDGSALLASFKAE